MKTIRLLFLVVLPCVLAGHLYGQSARGTYGGLAKPVGNGIWLQPAQGTDAIPLWGFKDGIRVGLHPIGGPRGLLRIFTPYMGQDTMKLINFIAFEPIPAGKRHRGLSELEFSRADNANGKRFWSGDTPDPTAFPSPVRPAPGVIATEDGEQVLTFYVFCEPFDNGAQVYVRIRLRESRPHELELTTYRDEKSVSLDSFILSATMGNYARLRVLHLCGGRTKLASDLWPGYSGIHFTEHDRTPLCDLVRDGRGGAWFLATPDEEEPWNATYAENTRNHWKYEGLFGTQYWYAPDPHPQLTGQVNGRYCYWASQSPIPGGVSYENFEYREPFREGAVFVFGITPGSAQRLIDLIEAK